MSTYNTRKTNYNNPQFKIKHNIFRNSFFPFAIIEWNKLDPNIRKSESLNIFKKIILQFILPSGGSVFNVHNPKGVNY